MSEKMLTNIDIIKMYQETWDEMKKLIEEVKTKSKRAMRITLWLKVIVAFASISAIGAWLRANGNGQIWALILIFAQIADMLFDTLPYFQQRITLPQQQLKLEHIEIDLKKDLLQFEMGLITAEEAFRRYFEHRKSWVKAIAS
ncbi:hypothetical protein [Lysinibacillus sp. 38-6]|uniref:hypothetical protein n=1 Tax=Lysinibacillus sp. 38-6 TaxID=3385991 RepID=UPI003908A931